MPRKKANVFQFKSVQNQLRQSLHSSKLLQVQIEFNKTQIHVRRFDITDWYVDVEQTKNMGILMELRSEF